MNTIHKITIISMLFFGVFSNIYAQKNNGMAYIDLGLPSGTLWAANNIDGKRYNAGKKFAWGETKGGSDDYWYWREILAERYYKDHGYKFGKPGMSIAKYCSNPAFG